MKRYLILLLLASVLLASCGYRVGGVLKPAMRGLKTYNVEMFANQSIFPNVAMQVTTAVADTLQRDGSFSPAPADKSDFTVRGTVMSVSGVGLRTNAGDTYLSSEVGLIVHVQFVIVNNRTGRVIINKAVNGEGSYFNESIGNAQTARESALSYATRRAAELLVQSITIP